MISSRPLNFQSHVSVRASVAERPEKLAMLSPSIWTEQATGLSLSPLQTGQGRVSPSSRFSKDFSAARSASSWESKSFADGISVQTSPKPRQCSHQPCGELKEKSRGSISSKERAQSGQFISELRIRKSSLRDPLDGTSIVFALLAFVPLALFSLEVFGVFAVFEEGFSVTGVGRALAVPLPISRACFANSRTPLEASFSIVPIRTSMVCSLKRSSD